MTTIISGLIFGNTRKTCLIEMLTQISYITTEVEVLSFRKIRNKDLYKYKCKIKIN